MDLEFEFKEDREYFINLLLDSIPSSIFISLFDFRSPIEKRKEFDTNRKVLLPQLLKLYGKNCMLQLGDCDINSGIAIDHLIPISTNKLNKEIRKLKAEKGKKVKAQSFGSNHINNLVIACNNCNNSKKHRLLDKETMQIILERKFAK